MSVKIQAEKRLARERRCREALEQEILKYRDYCTAQENEIDLLRGLLRKHGIQFEHTERPVVGSTIDVVAEVNELSEKVRTMESDDQNSSLAWWHKYIITSQNTHILYDTISICVGYAGLGPNNKADFYSL